MSEVNEEPGSEQPAPQEDPVKQIKAEFQRKTSNIEEKLAATTAQIDALLAEVTKGIGKKPEQAGKSTRDLLYDDPDSFVQSVTEKAVNRAREESASLAASQQALHTTIASFTAKYPELAQQDSEAMQLAVQFGNALPKHLKGTPEGAELAMSKAVAELGLAPVAKRKKVEGSSEDAAMGGGSKGSSGRKQSTERPDDATLAIAQLMGLDVNDKVRMDGIVKAKSRKSWTKYE